jgi:hypothetical protein
VFSRYGWCDFVLNSGCQKLGTWFILVEVTFYFVMTTNPAALMRVLITYAICIPIAILSGYILTDVGNDPTYSNLFVVGLLIALVLSPVLIKWHYPIMIFGLGCPMTLFFLKGAPPLWELVVIMSLGIAVVDRAVNSNQRFISAPSIVWPLLATTAMAYITAKLTGGIGLHTLGNEVGGGKKYITLFLGIATFFALISRKIPKEHRQLYIGLFFLSGLPAFISDLGPVLPYPLNAINLFFPSRMGTDQQWEVGITRLGAFGATAGVVVAFMAARFGIEGIFASSKALWRAPFFVLMLALTLLGGFRNVLFANVVLCILMFFMEGLHRTRLLPFFMLLGLVGACLLVPLAHKLPYTFQRAISFLPLNVDPVARADAQGSTEWRLQMWQDLLPQVPQYLLLGKGYALTSDDFEMMGTGTLANGAEARMDASEGSLAVAGDYHSGPLSTVIPFGIWGVITFLWFIFAGFRVLYRNLKFGDPQLKIINIYFFAEYLTSFIGFLFIFGSYSDAMFGFSRLIGFSIALNGGILGPQSSSDRATSPQFNKPWLRAQPQPV